MSPERISHPTEAPERGEMNRKDYIDQLRREIAEIQSLSDPEMTGEGFEEGADKVRAREEALQKAAAEETEGDTEKKIIKIKDRLKRKKPDPDSRTESPAPAAATEPPAPQAAAQGDERIFGKNKVLNKIMGMPPEREDKKEKEIEPGGIVGVNPVLWRIAHPKDKRPPKQLIGVESPRASAAAETATSESSAANNPEQPVAGSSVVVPIDLEGRRDSKSGSQQRRKANTPWGRIAAAAAVMLGVGTVGVAELGAHGKAEAKTAPAAASRNPETGSSQHEQHAAQAEKGKQFSAEIKHENGEGAGLLLEQLRHHVRDQASAEEKENNRLLAYFLSSKFDPNSFASALDFRLLDKDHPATGPTHSAWMHKGDKLVIQGEEMFLYKHGVKDPIRVLYFRDGALDKKQDLSKGIPDKLRVKDNLPTIDADYFAKAQKYYSYNPHADPVHHHAEHHSVQNRDHEPTRHAATREHVTQTGVRIPALEHPEERPTITIPSSARATETVPKASPEQSPAAASRETTPSVPVQPQTESQQQQNAEYGAAAGNTAHTKPAASNPAIPSAPETAQPPKASANENLPAEIRTLESRNDWNDFKNIDVSTIFANPAGERTQGAEVRKELFDVLRKSGLGPQESGSETVEQYLTRASGILEGGNAKPVNVLRTPDNKLAVRGGDLQARIVTAQEVVRTEESSIPNIQVLILTPELSSAKGLIVSADSVNGSYKSFEEYTGKIPNLARAQVVF